MKKFSILLVAAIMVLALTMPAAAFENEFGGYWRTRFYTQSNFAGTNNSPYQQSIQGSAYGPQDSNVVDTRTRIFYTAKFSENLKFVNKFEFNAVWGRNGGYGQVGADNTNNNSVANTNSNESNYFRVKNSYVDFKLSEQRFTVGIQDFLLARGYILNDDAAGVKAIFKVNDAIYLPFIYVKLSEGGQGYTGGNSNGNYDLNAYVFYPTVFLNKDNTLKPHVSYITSENASGDLAKNGLIAQNYQGNANVPGVNGNVSGPYVVTAVDVWSAGLEYDGKIGIFDLGATGIMQFGTARVNTGAIALARTGYSGATNTDVQACVHGYLFDLFGGVNLGPANIHAKGIYASGMEHYDTSGNVNQFFTFGPSAGWGSSYYWAEIMGLGIVDNTAPMGAPGDKMTNLEVVNFGASYKLLADLKFSADLWYAKHVANVTIATPAGQDQKYASGLGTELDLVATYTIVDNLKLDLIGAYLWAGDCITKASDPNGSANPVELAAQLSLAF
jgi:hypothetical protein